jgi:hypothetical protein
VHQTRGAQYIQIELLFSDTSYERDGGKEGRKQRMMREKMGGRKRRRGKWAGR